MALFNIGNNYKRLEKYDSAIIFYDKAFDSKKGKDIYLDFSNNNLTDIGDYDVPSYEINFERGIAHYYMGNFKKSFIDFNTSIHKDYRSAECYYWIGYIYLSQKQINLACENFNKSKHMGDKDAELASEQYCGKNVF